MSKRFRKAAVAAADGEGCASSLPQPGSAENEFALSLKAVAGMFKISPHTLRLYELRGLIRRVRCGRQWTYSWADCERIALIVKARKVGLSIRSIARIIKAMDVDAGTAKFEAGREQCLDLIRALELRKKDLHDVLGELHRIDWELSDRLPGKQATRNDPFATY